LRTLVGFLLAVAPLAAQVKLPPADRQVLANGAVVIMADRKNVPMVSVRAVLRGGAEADPTDKAGLAGVVAELLRRGSSAHTAELFSEQLDFIGAQFQSSAGEHSISVTMEFLKKDSGKATALLAEALLDPVFPEAEVKKVLAQRIDRAKAIKDDPGSANVASFRGFFYPARHPYHRYAGGDEISLARIARADITGYHRNIFRAKNLVLTASGDLNEATRQGLTAIASKFPAGAAFAHASDSIPLERNQPRLLLIDKPDATQTYFLIAQPGIHRTHPDRVVVTLINTLFGGRFTSMLNDELRVNSGLSYGAGSRVQMERITGALSISSFTKTETTAQAIDLAVAVLGRLRDKGIDAETLASAKAYLKGIYPPEHLETNSQLTALFAELELHDLSRDEVDGLFARLDAITLEQANAAARKYFKLDNLQFCLLGNAARIRDAAAKYAAARREIRITGAGFSVPEF
jgi:predicted Zn-dependent peptidase